MRVEDEKRILNEQYETQKQEVASLESEIETLVKEKSDIEGEIEDYVEKFIEAGKKATAGIIELKGTIIDVQAEVHTLKTKNDCWQRDGMTCSS